MSDYIAEVGDRVRVTIEGEVKRVNLFGLVQEISVETERGDVLYFDTDEAAVEKVEPPKPEYEKFGPGDVVRSKDIIRFIYTVGPADRYYDHTAKKWWSGALFTSEHYERVV